MATHDATASNRRRFAEGEAEVLEDWEGVVGKKLTAQLVARETIAIDQCDRHSSAGEERGQCRSGRAGADDYDVYFQSNSPNLNGHARRTSTRFADTRNAISPTSSGV